MINLGKLITNGSHTESSVLEDLGSNLIPREDRGGNEPVPKCSSLLSLPAEEQDVAAIHARVTWCAVSSEEKRKCDLWNRASNGRVTCSSFPTTEDCIISIMVGSRCLVWRGQRASWAQACRLLTVRMVTQEATGKEDTQGGWAWATHAHVPHTGAPSSLKSNLLWNFFPFH